MDDWQKRYYTKVLEYVKAPNVGSIDFETVRVMTDWSEAYSYSTYTSESAEFVITVHWERDGYRRLSGDEAIGLIRSFG